MIGRMTVIGIPMAAAKLSYVCSSSGAKTMMAAVASTLAMTMLAISQKPERVSNILRSSTATRRVRGMRADAGRARSRRPTASDTAGSVTVVVVMLLLLHGRCLR